MFPPPFPLLHFPNMFVPPFSLLPQPCISYSPFSIPSLSICLVHAWLMSDSLNTPFNSLLDIHFSALLLYSSNRNKFSFFPAFYTHSLLFPFCIKHVYSLSPLWPSCGEERIWSRQENEENGTSHLPSLFPLYLICIPLSLSNYYCIYYTDYKPCMQNMTLYTYLYILFLKHIYYYYLLLYLK